MLFILFLLHASRLSPGSDKPNTNKEAPDFISQLRKLPNVHSATSTPTKSKPKQFIIHLLNWHFVSKEDYAADLSASSDAKLSEAEIDKQYLEFLDDVEAIQKEQKQILRFLIKKHKVRSVYMEGLTEKNLSAFNSYIKTLRERVSFIKRQGPNIILKVLP
ncbi:hypothetical protein [Gimesia maris]|uniref:hypothetical protein n=1 Tax=Gimesia maris TaxID=122 RepID=UPI003A9040AA